MRRRSRRVALLIGLAFCLPGFPQAQAARAAVGTPVANVEMPTLDGGRARMLAEAGVTVLVFFRTNQDHSAGALREFAQCQGAFAGKAVRWAGIVSDTAPADGAAALVRDARFASPVLVDRGDALYGSLGISLHPVVVVVGRDRKLAAFEPFRSVDYCAVVTARIRHALGEISADELGRALEPPRAVEGGDEQVARRYRALAEAQFKAGNLDKAKESVQRSLEKNPQLAPAHALLGDILAAQGNCADAAGAFAQALAIEPANAAATTGRDRCTAAR